jgi:phosphoribosylaminoimidazole carboxylase PurE protein
MKKKTTPEKKIKPRIGILMGSDSDLAVMEEAIKILKEFGIPHEVTIASAHRSPGKVSRYAREAEDRGLEVLIAGAGGAAHLAGVLASETILPVIGVPMETSALKGMDSLLSTVQMPAGVPVATMGIGKSGAKNAGILAAQILARKDPLLADRLKRFKKEMAKGVEEQARALEWKSTP